MLGLSVAARSGKRHRAQSEPSREARQMLMAGRSITVGQQHHPPAIQATDIRRASTKFSCWIAEIKRTGRWRVLQAAVPEGLWPADMRLKPEIRYRRPYSLCHINKAKIAICRARGVRSCRGPITVPKCKEASACDRKSTRRSAWRGSTQPAMRHFQRCCDRHEVDQICDQRDR